MDEIMLRPRSDTLKLKGKVSYGEGAQAWNIIRFKKELLQEFPQLKEKISKIFYKLIFYKSHKELMKAVKNIKEKEEVLPILLSFYKVPTQI